MGTASICQRPRAGLREGQTGRGRGLSQRAKVTLFERITRVQLKVHNRINVVECVSIILSNIGLFGGLKHKGIYQL